MGNWNEIEFHLAHMLWHDTEAGMQASIHKQNSSAVGAAHVFSMDGSRSPFACFQYRLGCFSRKSVMYWSCVY